MTASNRGDASRQLGDTLVQNGGAESCYQTSSSVTGNCQRIAALSEQHDNYSRAAAVSFAAAGVTGAITTASLWIPAPTAIRVKPSAPGSVAGLTLEGAW